jgi:hypothetical protein
MRRVMMMPALGVVDGVSLLFIVVADHLTDLVHDRSHGCVVSE